MKCGSAYGIISDTLFAAYANSGLAGIHAGFQSSGYSNATRRRGSGCVECVVTRRSADFDIVTIEPCVRESNAPAHAGRSHVSAQLVDVERGAAVVEHGHELARRRVD